MRTVNGLVLAVVLAFGVPAVVDAQAQPPDTRQAPIERRVERVRMTVVTGDGSDY